MTTGGREGDSQLDSRRDEFIGNIDTLRREAELVYAELVLPRWGSADYQGLPRTLYGT
jgi:hypothetical protein